MVHICPERYPKNVVKKLHARTIGPYPILQKLESNAYLIDLLSTMSVNPVFNVANLLPYRGTFEPPICPLLFLQAHIIV